MEFFEHVSPAPNTEEKSYAKDFDYTKKCEQFFKLLYEMDSFLKPEHSFLMKRKDMYPKFITKINSIATIANKLHEEDAQEAIKEGYRLYVTENKRYHN
jgi:hypothetical protein